MRDVTQDLEGWPRALRHRQLYPWWANLNLVLSLDMKLGFLEIDEMIRQFKRENPGKFGKIRESNEPHQR